MSQTTDQPKTNATTSDVVANPKDIQGILALIVILGAFAMAAIAIWLQPANVNSVLSSVLPLAAVVTGYYFGQQSQRSQ